MKFEEYLNHVQYITNSHPQILRSLIENYFDWRSRSRLARWLLRVGQLVPAIDLFKTIVSVKVIETPEDACILSETEDKVWCMMELGQAIWQHEKNAEQALRYIGQAINMAQAYPWKFNFVVRGELLRHRWEILQASSQGDIACQEAVEQSQRVFPVRGKSNSVLFHAFSFLAAHAKKVNNVQLAISLLRKALRFFPEDYEDIKQLNAIWRNRHYQPEETYHNLIELTQHCNLVWDNIGEETPETIVKLNQRCVVFAPILSSRTRNF
ncbi:hypothetical protein [Sporomusa sp. KB1]|uniref:hypothetical protein n=1 Tax=Sporomusa sp. KB1 TaxID=943346 RepID=UPI0011AA434D|nr:hypothetical protein [Sporomusa sp. KB1]TWH49276.1 hypothetical protein Salpa_5486 [Sporomusa sp. KB1]